VGHRSCCEKELVDNCKMLSVFSLNRNQVFSGHMTATVEWRALWDVASQSLGIEAFTTDNVDCAGSVQIRYELSNRLTGDCELIEYNVELEATPCNFGGIRYWFVCPLLRDGIACKGRVGKLYLPPNETYFGCRSCYNLTYRSQKERRPTFSKAALKYFL
jgi:hypothetical protein